MVEKKVSDWLLLHLMFFQNTQRSHPDMIVDDIFRVASF